MWGTSRCISLSTRCSLGFRWKGSGAGNLPMRTLNVNFLIDSHASFLRYSYFTHLIPSGVHRDLPPPKWNDKNAVAFRGGDLNWRSPSRQSLEGV